MGDALDGDKLTANAAAPVMKTAGATADATKTLHLYILTGQSNSLGAVKDKPLTDTMLAAYQAQGVLMYNANITGYRNTVENAVANPVWEQLAPQEPGHDKQASAYSNNLCMGPEYGFAYIMQKNGWFKDGEETGGNMGVILASLDGGGNQYWESSSATYSNMLGNIKNAITAARGLGYDSISLDGLMYLQGESNSAAGAAAAKDKFNNFRAQLETDLSTWMGSEGISMKIAISGDDQNVVAGEPATWTLDNIEPSTSVSNVTAAQMLENATSEGKVNADGNGIGFVYTQDLGKTNVDGLKVHYTGNAQLTIGARYAYAFAVQNGIDVGAVRGQDDSATLDTAAAWWMEKLPTENDIAVWDISSVSQSIPVQECNKIADGQSITVGGIRIEEVYSPTATDQGQGSVAIAGGTINIGNAELAGSGITLVGGDLSISSAINVVADQTWNSGSNHVLTTSGNVNISEAATLTIEENSLWAFNNVIGTGNLVISNGVTLSMTETDLSNHSSGGSSTYSDGNNGFVNGDINLIALEGDGSITLQGSQTYAGALAGKDIALSSDHKSLQILNGDTSVYHVRDGVVVYNTAERITEASSIDIADMGRTGATLRLSAGLADGVHVTSSGNGGSISIDSGVMLDKDSLGTLGAQVSLAGEGSYSTSGWNNDFTEVNGYGLGGKVSLGSDWTGTVVLESSNSTKNMVDFARLTNGSLSTLELKGLNGWTTDWNGEIAEKLKLTDVNGTAAWTNAAASSTGVHTATMSGDWSGDGTFKLANSNRMNYTYTGDISQWQGKLQKTAGGQTDLTFSGRADTVNAAIVREGGTLNLFVNTSVTFNKDVKGIGNLTVAAGRNATFNGETSINGASSSIGGTVYNNGIMTLSGSVAVTGSLDMYERYGSEGTNTFSGQDQYAGSGYLTSSSAEYYLVKGGSGSQLTASSLQISGVASNRVDNGNILVTFGADDTIYHVNSNLAYASDEMGEAQKIRVAKNKILTVGSTGDVSSVLNKVTGDGTVKITAAGESKIENGYVTQGTGILQIGNGSSSSLATLKMGTGDGQANDLSSFSQVVLDNGKIRWQSQGSTLNNLTVTAAGGTFQIFDINPTAITWAGTTTLNGQLTLDNSNWGDKLHIEKLTGSGNFNNSSTSATDSLVVTIDSVENYTGTLSTSNTKTTINANLDGGTAMAGVTVSNGTINLTGQKAAGVGNLTVSGGSLNLDGSAAVSAGNITATGGSLNIGGNFSADLLTLGTSAGRGNNFSVAAGAVADITTISAAWGFSGFQVDGVLNTDDLKLSTGSQAYGVSGGGVINAKAIHLGNVGQYTLSVSRINVGNGGISPTENGSGTSRKLSGTTLGATDNWNSAMAFVLENSVTFDTSNAESTQNDGTGHTVSMTGALSGTGSVTKTGAGTLTLSGANNYSGGTTISAGTLKATAASALGTGAVALDGGTLDVTGLSSLTSSALTLNGGTLALGQELSLGSSNLVLNSGTIDVTGLMEALAATPATLAEDGDGSSTVSLTLVTTSGSIGGDVSGLSLAGVAGTSWESATLGISGSNLVLTMAAPETTDLIWDGSNNTWDVGATKAWHADGQAAGTSAFSTGANVTFETSTSTATLGAGIVARTMTLESGANLTVNTNGHDLTVADLDSNGGSLTKAGTGTATFGGADPEGITLAALSVTGGSAVFNEHVIVTGGSTIQPSDGSSLTLHGGLSFTGQGGSNSYALIVGSNVTVTLGGTSDLSAKNIGANSGGRLVLEENANVSAYGVRVSTTANRNGSLELGPNATLTVGVNGIYTTGLTMASGSTLTLNGNSTLWAQNVASSGTIEVIGAKLTLGTDNNNASEYTLADVKLNNGELYNNTGGDNAQRNIAQLTIDGSNNKLTQRTWRTLWNIGALNDGDGTDARVLTWVMNGNHNKPSVLSLTGEGNYSGRLVADRTDGASNNGNYQGYVQVDNGQALKNAVLELKGGNANRYMSLALNAAEVSMSGLSGTAYSVVYGGTAPESVSSSTTMPASTRDSVLTVTGNGNETFSGVLQDRVTLKVAENAAQTIGAATVYGDLVASGVLTLLSSVDTLNDVTITSTGTLKLAEYGDNAITAASLTLGSGATLDLSILGITGSEADPVTLVKGGTIDTTNLGSVTLLFSDSALEGSGRLRVVNNNLVLTFSDPAIKDLIWDGANKTWDVGTTQAWHAEGQGTGTSVFSTGANVTFETSTSTATLGAGIVAGTMTLESGANLTVNTNGHDLTVADLDSNGGSLTKTGTGAAAFGGSDEGGNTLAALTVSDGTATFSEKLTVTGNVTLSTIQGVNPELNLDGGTMVNGTVNAKYGTINIGADSTIAKLDIGQGGGSTGNIVVKAGATLTLNDFYQTGSPNSISTLRMEKDGVVKLPGNVTVKGLDGSGTVTRSNKGQYSVANGDFSLTNVEVSFRANGVALGNRLVDSAVNSAYNATLSNAGNTLTSTTVTANTLTVSAAMSLGDVSVAGGTLSLTNSSGAVTIGSGSIAGDGTLTLSRENQFVVNSGDFSFATGATLDLRALNIEEGTPVTLATTTGSGSFSGLDGVSLLLNGIESTDARLTMEGNALKLTFAEVGATLIWGNHTRNGYWSNEGTDTNWHTPNNVYVPASFNASDRVQFTGTGKTTVTLKADVAPTDIKIAGGDKQSLTLNTEGNNLTVARGIAGAGASLVLNSEGSDGQQTSVRRDVTLKNLTMIDGTTEIGGKADLTGKLTADKGAKVTVGGVTNAAGVEVKGDSNVNLAGGVSAGSMVVNSSTVTIGANSSVGSLTMTDSTLTNNATLSTGNTAPAKLVGDNTITGSGTLVTEGLALQDGTTTVSGSQTINITSTAGITGTAGVENLVLNDGTTLTGTSSYSIGSTVDAVTLDGTVSFDSAGHVISVETGLGGDGSLVKAGTGTLKLNQANSFTGTTRVSGGTLQVNDAAALTSSGGITVGNGGTLWFNNEGTAAVKDTTILDGGTLFLTHENALSTTGTLTLGGTSKLNLSGLAITGGQTEYVLAEAGTITLASGFDINDVVMEYGTHAKNGSTPSITVRDKQGGGKELVLTYELNEANTLYWNGGSNVNWTAENVWHDKDTSGNTTFARYDDVFFDTREYTDPSTRSVQVNVVQNTDVHTMHIAAAEGGLHTVTAVVNSGQTLNVDFLEADDNTKFIKNGAGVANIGIDDKTFGADIELLNGTLNANIISMNGEDMKIGSDVTRTNGNLNLVVGREDKATNAEFTGNVSGLASMTVHEGSNATFSGTVTVPDGVNTVFTVENDASLTFVHDVNLNALSWVMQGDGDIQMKGTTTISQAKTGYFNSVLGNVSVYFKELVTDSGQVSMRMDQSASVKIGTLTLSNAGQETIYFSTQYTGDAKVDRATVEIDKVVVSGDRGLGSNISKEVGMEDYQQGSTIVIRNVDNADGTREGGDILRLCNYVAYFSLKQHGMAPGWEVATVFRVGDSTASREAAFDGVFRLQDTSGTGNWYGTEDKHKQTVMVVEDEFVASNSVIEIKNYCDYSDFGVGIGTNYAQVVGIRDYEGANQKFGVNGNKALLFSGEMSDATDAKIGSDDTRRKVEFIGEAGDTAGTVYASSAGVDANLDIVKSGAGKQVFKGDSSNFNADIDVMEGVLEFLNNSNLHIEDLTLAAGGSAADKTLKIRTDANEAIAANRSNVGMADVHGTMTAKAGSALDSNLTMNVDAVLDVSGAVTQQYSEIGGNKYDYAGGLNMLDNSLTLHSGAYLSTTDLNRLLGMTWGEKYELAYNVGTFYLGDGVYTKSMDNPLAFSQDEHNTAVEASKYFANLQEEDYYICYTGSGVGVNGSNVGVVYIYKAPEPTTGTLSLLALAALCARRRRQK